MGRVRRREFLIAASALATASLSRAQAPNSGQPRRIGVLGLNFAPTGDARQIATSVHFRKLGWIEGENLLVERAFADLETERLPKLAEELVRKQVEVIWTFGTEAAIAAARATRTIPIVFFDPPYPIEQGLIDSWAHPGRNATGTAYMTDSKIVDKLFELLREIAPTAKRVWRLSEPATLEMLAGGYYDYKGQLALTAQRFGFEIRYLEIRKVADIETALAGIQIQNSDAIMIGGGYHLPMGGKRIAEFSIRNRLPSVALASWYADAGGLLSYGIARSESAAMLLRNVEYIDRILRGAKPGDLPVERPSKIELVLNAKTAKAVGLSIPQSLLARADRVIE